MVVVVRVICNLLSLSSLWCMFYSVCGFNFNLMINSIIIMLNFVMCCRFWVLWLFMRLRIGLIIMFVMRYFSIDLSFM